MASIPHGAIINAQGFPPARDPKTITGGVPGCPVIDDIDTTPLKLGGDLKDAKARFNNVFTSMVEDNQQDFRIP